MPNATEQEALDKLLQVAIKLRDAADYLQQLIGLIGVDDFVYGQPLGIYRGGNPGERSFKFTRESFNTNLNAINEWQRLSYEAREVWNRLEADIARREREVRAAAATSARAVQIPPQRNGMVIGSVDFTAPAPLHPPPVTTTKPDRFELIELD